MKVVLLVIEGPRSKYEYLRRIMDTPYRIILVKNEPATAQSTDWHRAYVPDDDVIHVPSRNPSRVLDKVKAFLHERHISASGILTYRDTAVPLAQYLAEGLSLPRICAGDPHKVRNKGVMRAVLSAAGLTQPVFRVCDTRDDAVAAARELGPPIVVKPSEMVSSLGVSKLASVDPDLVRRAFDDAVEADFPTERLRYEFNLSPQVIVERFVSAYQEISVEGLVIGGNTTIFGITKKRVRSLPGFEFAEVGHAFPFGLGDGQGKTIHAIVRDAVAALQLQYSAFHAELLLAPDLPPIVTEVGARLAGDFIPMLVEHATAANFIEATVAASTGVNIIRTVSQPTSCVGVDFIVAPQRSATLAQLLAQLRAASNVIEAVEYVGATHGRLGHVMYRGGSIAELNKLGDQYQSLLEDAGVRA